MMGAAGILPALAGNCAPVTISDRRRALLHGWLEERLLADYDAFIAACVELELRVQTLVAQPTLAGLQAARDQWWAARAPWKRAEIFAFGPYLEGPRLGPKIDFWPLRPEIVEMTLASAELWGQQGVPESGRAHVAPGELHIAARRVVGAFDATRGRRFRSRSKRPDRAAGCRAWAWRRVEG